MSTGSIVEKPELLLEPSTAVKKSSLWQWAALGAILLGSFGHLLIKLGVTAATHNIGGGSLIARIGHYFLQPTAVTGLAVYGAGTLLWIYAVSQRDISFLYPLTALTYVTVALGGKFMLGETISTERWLGIGIVMIGVAMLQFSAKGDRP